MARLAIGLLCLTVALSLAVAAPNPAPPAKAQPALKELPNHPPTKQVIGVPIGLEGFRGVLSADGKWLAAADNQGSDVGVGVAVFDLATGKRVRHLPIAKNRAHQSITAVALSGDGKVLVASGGTSAMNSIEQVPQINVWDFASGRERMVLTGFKKDHRSLSLSADGRWLASSSSDFAGAGGEVRLWDLSTGKPAIVLDNVADVRDSCVSPDGKAFVLLGRKAWHLYDVASAKETAVVPYNVKKSQNYVRISPDGKTLVTSGDNLSIVWDLPAKTPRKMIAAGWPSSLPCFTADSRLVLPVPTKAVYFDSATGDAIGALTCAMLKYSPSGLTISGDGKTLATVASDRVRIFDASTLEPAPALAAVPDAMSAVQADIPGVPAAGSTTGKTPGNPAPVTPPPAVSGVPSTPSTNPAAMTPPKVVPPIKPPVPAVAAEDAFVGKWSGTEAGFDETWTIARVGEAWQVTVVYKKASVEAGNGHGENVKFADGALTFTRVLDKKPARSFSDNTNCRMVLKNGRLDYTSSAGSKTAQHTFERVAGS